MSDCHSHDDKKQETKSSCCSSKAEAKPVQSSCHSEEVAAETSCCASKAKPAATSCCGTESRVDSCAVEDAGCCGETKSSIDWIMWGSIIFVAVMYALYLVMGHSEGDITHDGSMPNWLVTMSHTSFEMLNAMWWGVLLGVFLVGWLNRIPREVVIAALGKGHTKRGLFRATLAGLMLDLCNHGILMVAMKLYERGASLGQVMAFLIASPWNSFTLTLILFGLIGVKWTLAFIVFSMLIAWISGWIFDKLEITGKLPMNPYKEDLPDDYRLWPALGELAKNADYSAKATTAMIWDGVKGARMVIRWIMFGVVLVAFLRAFVPLDIFETWFGATIGGLFLTLVAATVIEVCSEGSTPIAADLVNRAAAPGNGFTFLMAGAATDYTEIMSIKDTMKSWKIALFLPLITVPQVLFIGWVMNMS